MILRRDSTKSTDARSSECATALRGVCVLIFLVLILPFTFGCRQRPVGTVTTRPAVWPESSTKGCDLERIWTHTLDELKDLTEEELAACRAGCQQDDGAACVAAGLLHYSGIRSKKDTKDARELFRLQCNAGQFAGCVSLWMTDLDEHGDGYPRSRNIGSLERLDTYCSRQGERHACEALATHYYRRLRIVAFPWDVKMALGYLNTACAKGSLSGCTHLGELYLKGIGVQKDQKRAAKLVEAQCQRGHVLACGLLGDIYEQGLGVPVDEAKAAELFRTACDGGIPMSCYQYGDTHWPLTYRESDVEKAKLALAYFERACSGRVGLGCEALGLAYLEGKGVGEDHARGLQYYEKACELGVGTACLSLGLEYELGEDVDEDVDRAARYFRAGCRVGEPSSCYNLGLYYRDGYVVEQSDVLARECFISACVGGVVQACYEVARQQAHGLAGYKNERHALRNMETACSGHVREACDELDFYVRYHRFRPLEDMDTSMIFLESCHHGSMQACHELGLMYNRWGPDAVYSAMAAVVFQKACAGGIHAACAELGNAYLDGRGVPLDAPKGLKLVEDACRNHHGWACYSLGMRYHEGNQVAKDDFKAVLLLDDACARLPEVCGAATTLREQYRAEHEPAKPESNTPPGPIP